MNILIEGVGGVGGVIAGALIRAGYSPTLLTNNEKITETINGKGLKVTTPEGQFTVSSQAVTHLDQLPEGCSFDAALLIMKATSVVEAAKDTLPFLGPDGYLVTFQNGIVEEAVAQAVRRERVLSGIIGWGATMHGPGDCERTGPGAIHLGELDCRISERMKSLAKLLEEATPVVMTDNIYGALWSKLAINSTITTMGALTGELLGKMLQNSQARKAFLTVYSEVVETAEANGIRLEKVTAPPKLLYLQKNAGLLTRLIKDILVRLVAKKHGKLKSSSLQSLERGRRTEIDFLNGHVVEKAKTVGLEVPMNAALTRMIKEIERGDRKICAANLSELLSEL